MKVQLINQKRTTDDDLSSNLELIDIVVCEEDSNANSNDEKSFYRREAKRLLTYIKTFCSTTMTAISLANAGFISTGKKDSDEVICLWCGLMLSEFQETVDACALHQAITGESCDFIVNFSTLNKALTGSSKRFLDLPLAQDGEITRLQSGVQHRETTVSLTHEKYTYYENRFEILARVPPLSLRHGDETPMRYECLRLQTFLDKTWTKKYAEPMAQAGFYILMNDQTKRLFALTHTFTLTCPFCEKVTYANKDTIPKCAGVLERKNLSPLEVHSVMSPRCPFVQGTRTCGNVPIVTGGFRWESSETVTVSSEATPEEVEVAKFPMMAVYGRRLQSFLTFPSCHVSQFDLSLAGFFYEGNGESVTCFWCGVVSSSWSRNEDPWERHARSSITCQHVRNEMGSGFIDQTIGRLGLYSGNCSNNHTTSRIQNVTPRMLSPRMDSPVTQMVLDMGFKRDLVKAAICLRLKCGKPDYTQAADLVVDVMALEKKDQPYHRVLRLPHINQVTVIPNILHEENNNGPSTENSDTETSQPTEDSSLEDLSRQQNENHERDQQIQTLTMAVEGMQSDMRRMKDEQDRTRTRSELREQSLQGQIDHLNGDVRTRRSIRLRRNSR